MSACSACLFCQCIVHTYRFASNLRPPLSLPHTLGKHARSNIYYADVLNLYYADVLNLYYADVLNFDDADVLNFDDAYWFITGKRY